MGLNLKGVSWPWKISPQITEDLQTIDEAIHDVLFTPLGERKKNLKYGSQLTEIIFENKGEIMYALARREISHALNEHLPGVRLLNIDIIESDDDNEPVTIEIYWDYQGQPGKTKGQISTQ